MTDDDREKITQTDIDRELEKVERMLADYLLAIPRAVRGRGGNLLVSTALAFDGRKPLRHAR